MSVRQAQPGVAIGSAIGDVSADGLKSEYPAPVDVNDPTTLGEGSTGYVNKSIDDPLKRTVVVGIRATLGELTTTPNRAQWSPSPDTIKAIYQPKQYVNLSGQHEPTGDIKSVVVHSIEARSVSSTFPIALGAEITGVDRKYYSSIGSAYSMVTLPNQKSASPTVLQKEDPRVAYDFAARYPVRASNDSNSSSNNTPTPPSKHEALLRN